MIRLTAITDLNSIEQTYHEHFAYEEQHGAYTIFQKGVYPTRKDAKKALSQNALFIYEENNEILGSLILNNTQPEEYKKIDWTRNAEDEKIKVIHLLMVRPCAAGKGIGSALVNFAVEMAKKQSCTAIRLDTGAQNKPAISLYKKMGFQLMASTSMKVGGVIPHEGHLFFEKAVSINF